MPPQATQHLSINPTSYYPLIHHSHNSYMSPSSIPPSYYPGYPLNLNMPVGPGQHSLVPSEQHGLISPQGQHPLTTRPPYNLYGVPSPIKMGEMPPLLSIYGHPSGPYGIPPNNLYPTPYLNRPMYNPNLPNHKMTYSLN